MGYLSEKHKKKHGSGDGGIRTHKYLVLSQAALPIRRTSPFVSVARQGIEPCPTVS